MPWLITKVLKRQAMAAVLTLIMGLLIFLTGASSSVFGVQFYTNNERPFEIPLDIWVTKWWTWWVTTTTEEATPKDGQCLMHRVDSMVMLMDPAIEGKPHQNCKILSTEGIMFPIWSAWNDNTTQGYEQSSDEEISRGARVLYNLGAVDSRVAVDGVNVAELKEVSSMRLGSLDYKINAMKNVTEIYSKGFDITIPEDTHFPDQVPGIHRAGAHGWYIFLKPLPPGNHTIFYKVGVTGLGPNDHSSEITYSLEVQ